MQVFRSLVKRLRPHAVTAILLLIGAGVCAAYFYSLFHVARGDHLCFLADYAQSTGWFDKTFGAIYYNRTRLFSPGDTLLFRPLFFFIQGVENAAFGYGPFWWQLVGLLSHLFTVGALWKLLSRWGDRKAALVFVILFAFMFSNCEAVIWHGVTPYVLFAGFILLALERLEVWKASEGRSPQSLYASAGWITAAALTQEMGAAYALCFLVYALVTVPQRSGRWHALLFLAPVFVYISWSFGHAWLTRTSLGSEGAGIWGKMDPGLTARNFFRLAKWFVAGGLFLQPEDIRPVTRLMVDKEAFSWAWPFSVSWTAGRWAGMGLGVALFAGAVLAFWRRRPLPVGRALLLLAMLAAFVLVSVLGRMNVLTDGTGMECSLYYFYHFWVLLTPLLFLLIQRLFAPGRLRIASGLLSILVLVFSLLNAMEIRTLTRIMARDHAAVRRLMVTVDHLIGERSREPGFSFYVSRDIPGNYWPYWVVKKDDLSGKQYSLIERLYPRYFNDRDPRYTVRFDQMGTRTKYP